MRIHINSDFWFYKGSPWWVNCTHFNEKWSKSFILWVSSFFPFDFKVKAWALASPLKVNGLIKYFTVQNKNLLILLRTLAIDLSDYVCYTLLLSSPNETGMFRCFIWNQWKKYQKAIQMVNPVTNLSWIDIRLFFVLKLNLNYSLMHIICLSNISFLYCELNHEIQLFLRQTLLVIKY